MEEISVTGGARIGGVNATWPLAKLFASAARLKLISVIDTYDFLASDVVSLVRYGSIPFFSSGVRIVHARQDYPPKIIFWYLGNPETILRAIHEIGFVPTAPAGSEIKWRGIPVRWTTILLFILAWNGLFLLGGAVPRILVKRPELFSLIPLFFAFAISWRTKTSPRLQKMILREGRSVNEIKAFLSLVQIVSGILLVAFAGLLVTHVFG
jgi:hypothetical protein